MTIRMAVRDAGQPSWRYWGASVIAEDARGSFDDNPWLTIDTEVASPHRGRLYLGWMRSVAGRRIGFEISHSDDRGAHWSEPRLISDSVADPGYPSLSIATDGAVYAAWHDFARGALFLDMSTDGGETFGPDVQRPLRGRDLGNCPNGRPIAAQGFRCVRSDPTVIADRVRNRVYLTYADLAPNGSEDLFVAAYDAALRPVNGFPRRIGPVERKPSDQFWPTSALETSQGRLVLCFYTTSSGTARARATFSCAVSQPLGRQWSRTMKVANVSSDETKPHASEFGYGDYEGLVVAGGVAHPVWTDSRDLPSRAEEIYTASFPVAALLPPPRSQRQVDVSNAPGSQNEPAIAVDPSDPQVLIASSNSLVSPMSVYTSTDAGASWSSQAVPPDRPNGVCLGDPALTIDTRGREYFAFLRDAVCGTDGATGLIVATRNGPRGDWRVPPESLAGPLKPNESNDKPAIAADTSATSPFRDRVYVAWARAVGSDVHAIVVSHSDDGGKTWTGPTRVDSSSIDSGYPSIATGPGGEVYVAWHPFEEDRFVIAASFDGGDHFGAARTIDSKRARSSCPASWPIPAQARRCVRPNPIVSVDSSGGAYRGRVYVSYENKAADGTQDVFLAAFDRSLSPILGSPTGRRLPIAHYAHPARYPADQFWPASAVDQGSGTLWVCFYDTLGDRTRQKAWFSCTRSSTGGSKWVPVVRVATVPSDATPSWVSPFQYGDYEGIAVSNGFAHPIWADLRRGRSALREEIYTASVPER